MHVPLYLGEERLSTTVILRLVMEVALEETVTMTKDASKDARQKAWPNNVAGI